LGRFPAIGKKRHKKRGRGGTTGVLVPQVSKNEYKKVDANITSTLGATGVLAGQPKDTKGTCLLAEKVK